MYEVRKEEYEGEGEVGAIDDEAECGGGERTLKVACRLTHALAAGSDR